MTDEEKEAIKELDKFSNSIDMTGITAEEGQIILKLIENQQKEIEEYKRLAEINLNNEEKEAIELLENDKENIINSFYDVYHISTARQYGKSFKVLLSLIEKQQKEIEKCKMLLRTSNQIFKIDNNMLDKKDLEIAKQDKIIDLMANYIYAVDYRNECGKTRIQVKQYFKKEAENEKR